MVHMGWAKKGRSTVNLSWICILGLRQMIRQADSPSLPSLRGCKAWRPPHVYDVLGSEDGSSWRRRPGAHGGKSPGRLIACEKGFRGFGYGKIYRKADFYFCSFSPVGKDLPERAFFRQNLSPSLTIRGPRNPKTILP